MGFPPQGYKADISTLETRLTADRAALLDNLLSIEASDTIVHPAGVGEQDSLEITPAELTEYAIVLLDFNALTQNITIRVYIEIDGTNERLISSAVFPTDFPTNAKGVPVELWPMSVDWKITLQSAVTEGVARNVPYRYVRRSLE
ncbi:unnamed protein product [marine sediment metagenome]|uniref:Uncharacterized protein n=1 Tax=marine sediment metagenome TaxID=412755 RepID=X1K9I1_9ZZZZ